MAVTPGRPQDIASPAPRKGGGGTPQPFVPQGQEGMQLLQRSLEQLINQQARRREMAERFSQEQSLQSLQHQQNLERDNNQLRNQKSLVEYEVDLNNPVNKLKRAGEAAAKAGFKGKDPNDFMGAFAAFGDALMEEHQRKQIKLNEFDRQEITKTNDFNLDESDRLTKRMETTRSYERQAANYASMAQAYMRSTVEAASGKANLKWMEQAKTQYEKLQTQYKNLNDTVRSHHAAGLGGSKDFVGYLTQHPEVLRSFRDSDASLGVSETGTETLTGAYGQKSIALVPPSEKFNAKGVAANIANSTFSANQVEELVTTLREGGMSVLSPAQQKAAIGLLYIGAGGVVPVKDNRTGQYLQATPENINKWRQQEGFGGAGYDAILPALGFLQGRLDGIEEAQNLVSTANPIPGVGEGPGGKERQAALATQGISAKLPDGVYRAVRTALARSVDSGLTMSSGTAIEYLTAKRDYDNLQRAIGMGGNDPETVSKMWNRLTLIDSTLNTMIEMERDPESAANPKYQALVNQLNSLMPETMETLQVESKSVAEMLRNEEFQKRFRATIDSIEQTDPAFSKFLETQGKSAENLQTVASLAKQIQSQGFTGPDAVKKFNEQLTSLQADNAMYDSEEARQYEAAMQASKPSMEAAGGLLQESENTLRTLVKSGGKTEPPFKPIDPELSKQLELLTKDITRTYSAPPVDPIGLRVQSRPTQYRQEFRGNPGVSLFGLDTWENGDSLLHGASLQKKVTPDLRKNFGEGMMDQAPKPNPQPQQPQQPQPTVGQAQPQQLQQPVAAAPPPQQPMQPGMQPAMPNPQQFASMGSPQPPNPFQQQQPQQLPQASAAFA